MTITDKTFSIKIGEAGAPQNTHTLILNGSTDIEYVRCTFAGDGIKLDNCQRIKFTDCTIKDARRTSGNHQAIFAAGCNDLTFTNLTIQNCTQAAQIFGGNNLTWTGGLIQKVDYGIKASVGGSKNWRFDGIVIQRDRAMGIELQYDDANTANVVVRNCAYAEAERWNNDAQNAGPRMAFSIPFTKATGTIIENNYADGLCWLVDAAGQRQSSSSWLGVRIGIECGGQGTIVRNNWIRRLNDAGSVVPNSANCVIGPNLVQECLEPFNMQGGAPVGSNIFGQNDDTVLLPSDGGWKLLGLTPPGTATPPPIVTPPIQPELEARVAALEQWRELMKGANK